MKSTSIMSTVETTKEHDTDAMANLAHGAGTVNIGKKNQSPVFTLRPLSDAGDESASSAINVSQRAMSLSRFPVHCFSSFVAGLIPAESLRKTGSHS
jgi:hypothetical protein